MLAVLFVCLSLLFVLRHKRVALLFLVATCLVVSDFRQIHEPELILFSVGQGEAMLLRAEGKTLLIDGGGLRSDNIDVGERLLAPALGALGIHKLDAIILTHNHPDHSGGLTYIVKNFVVEEFWSRFEFSFLRPDLGRALLEQGVK